MGLTHKKNNLPQVSLMVGGELEFESSQSDHALMFLTTRLTFMSWIYWYDYQFMDTDLCSHVAFLPQFSSTQVLGFNFGFLKDRCIRKIRG